MSIFIRQHYRSFHGERVVLLSWANEKQVSPFCATAILLQLLARPLWVGIAEAVAVDEVGRGVLVIVADVEDTPT